MSKKTRWPLDAALEAFGNEPTVADLAKYQLHPDRISQRVANAPRNLGLRAPSVAPPRQPGSNGQPTLLIGG
jgi:hypothetical protein